MTPTLVSLRRVCALLLTTLSAVAVAAYPDKPVHVVMPYTPGGATDLTIRLMQPALEKELGQSLIVEYKPGAGGAIATSQVARAKPDGYTILLAATNSFVIDQFLNPREGHDPLKDFEPVIKLTEVPAVLFSSKKSNITDWPGLKAKATAPDAQLNLGTPGIGTTPHLSLVRLNDAIGADIVHAPFRGAAPAIQALVADDVQLYLGNYQPVLAYLQEGRVHAIAVKAAHRLPGIPDVPTMEEAGIPPVFANNWFALAMPAGTPQDVVTRFAQAVEKVMQDPALQKAYAERGLEWSGVAGQALRDDLKAEAATWKAIIEKANLRAAAQ